MKFKYHVTYFSGHATVVDILCVRVSCKPTNLRYYSDLDNVYTLLFFILKIDSGPN